jgi:hypothetical protein
LAAGRQAIAASELTANAASPVSGKALAAGIADCRSPVASAIPLTYFSNDAQLSSLAAGRQAIAASELTANAADALVADVGQ